MKIAYFSCSSGAAGDMIMAACIDAGLSKNALEKALKKHLKLQGWKLKVAAVERKHFPALQLDVVGDKQFESPAHMARLFKSSTLPARVKERALRILDTLVRAEAKVHGVPVDRVHFHEINSLDTVIDIAGASLALDMLKIDAVCASPLNVGRAAPATIEIAKEMKVPVYSGTAAFELATPTGMAILSTIASFGPMPVITLERSGRGAGSQVIPDIPNVLQVLIGTADGKQAKEDGYAEDAVLILETNIDDMDPRIYPYVIERAFAAGARDAWLTPVIMKKGRPGILLSVLCTDETEAAITRIIFEETTTLGVRRIPCSRHVLRRRLEAGKKTAFLPGGKARTRIEFEEAKKRALRSGKPLSRFIQ